MLFPLALRENKSTTAHAHTFVQSIHMCFSLAPHGYSTKYAHTDIFSVHSFHFSPCGQVETYNYCAYTDILQFTTYAFLRQQHALWFLQLLNRLHAFVSHWWHCFLHVSKSVVVVLLTCQLEKCLEKENCEWAVAFACTNGLKKCLYNLPCQLLKDIFPVH